ncbi:hypothetical protein GGS23DRAFT_31853 [Durotheca rogersii]|uniref:uncharacterized protein n=1 Tax=Durotheca rogersii TaxID=419775 RepID=UPI0022207B87|nr:uncharacterized protein GGS23DRAFT_31853 [Durotheca rogersii]KAI5868461.1 hypothetical protein GGS23DRAFT_31853 [Durotheca rogersii]
MARRYPVDVLVFLRESPLCVKPSTLPPAEEWMGLPPETFRTSQPNKPTTDRSRTGDNPLLDSNNRRAGVDRHVSRNPSNPEDIVLGPPRTTFTSAILSRSGKPFDGDKALKDVDTRDRFSFRARNGDADNSERLRDRERDRDGRTGFRRRGDADQDNDGWSTVKPRKSFGHEGAERFHGRMGDRPDRFGGDRRPREQEDRDNGDRPRRNFGEFSKEKEGDDGEKPRRNGLNRNRTDQPWIRDNNDAPPPRERFDRSKSWRERTSDDHQGEAAHDKPRERVLDRRWDRDREQRQEREPEWLDEPAEDQPQAHTREDFEKFMENMKAGKNSAKAEVAPAEVSAPPPEKIDVEKTTAKPAPTIDMGPDKFFAAFAQTSNVETPGAAGETTKETAVPAVKPKSGSRFQNFFSSQEESRRQVESPPVVASAPPMGEGNPLLAMAGAQNDTAEKVAFQALLQKLQKQTLQASTPPPGGFSEPPPSHAIASPVSFQPYGQERREEPLARVPVQSQDIHTSRPHLNPQFAGVRSEQQMLHDLIGQRHASQGQGAGRSDQPSGRNSNSNAEFLMTLMQSSRAAPETRGNEQLSMRMPQPSRPAQILPTPDRDIDYQHERNASLQHQAGRSVALPSFFDEAPAHRREQETRPQQPTQILQRQGPPGLDQMHPSAWMQNNGQQLPPPGRPMIPPPGLAGNPRNGPIPGGFPPSFPMGGFPPEGMAGLPRNMGPPPGFFGGPPPPGFIPPGIGGYQGGPESLTFGFDHRGMPPPPGAFRRN